jgi:histidinol phosphatase-like enzyme
MAKNGIKTGGRQKGSVNKKTADVLDRVERVMQLIESKYLENDIKKLTANQRTILYASMMEYKAPKLQRTTHVGDKENPVYTVEL